MVSEASRVCGGLGESRRDHAVLIVELELLWGERELPVMLNTVELPLVVDNTHDYEDFFFFFRFCF